MEFSGKEIYIHDGSGGHGHIKAEEKENQQRELDDENGRIGC